MNADAAAIEQQLAKVLGLEPVAVRHHPYSVIEERFWRSRDLTERRSSFRFVRRNTGARTYGIRTALTPPPVTNRRSNRQRPERAGKICGPYTAGA
jgi:hypothetical protein